MSPSTLALVRRFAVPIVCAAACALPAAASAAPQKSARATARASSGQSTSAGAPIPVPASNVPPAGRRLSANQVLAIADTLPKMRAVRAKYRGSYGGAYLKPATHWQVSYFSRDGKKEIGQVIIDDLSGRVLEQWTGFQVAWTMARGYPGAFGRHVNALYVWLPLCVLFVLPFIDFRRPLSLLHLVQLVTRGGIEGLRQDRAIAECARPDLPAALHPGHYCARLQDLAEGVELERSPSPSSRVWLRVPLELEAAVNGPVDLGIACFRRNRVDRGADRRSGIVGARRNEHGREVPQLSPSHVPVAVQPAAAGYQQRDSGRKLLACRFGKDLENPVGEQRRSNLG